MRWNRLAAAAGIAYVLLAFVEFFGPGFPQTSDAPRVLDTYFVAHRSWSLVAVAVQGVANSIWIIFLCGLALLLRRAGSAAAASVALVGGALNVAISLSGLASIAAIAFGVAGNGTPDITRAFFEMSAMTLVLSNFLLALMAAAVAAAAAAAVPGWFAWFSGVVSAVFLLGGFALARHGAFSPDGVVQFATYGLELLWTLAASLTVARARTKEANEQGISPSVPPGQESVLSST
jgi:hypothetical protein